MIGGTIAGACAVAVLLAVAMPATGQDPPPPCAPGTALTPDRLGFESADDTNVATQSLTLGHPGDAYVYMSEDATWLPSATRITGPPGLQVKASSDDQHAQADFTPTTQGPLTFTATWTQTKASVRNHRRRQPWRRSGRRGRAGVMQDTPRVVPRFAERCRSARQVAVLECRCLVH